MLTFRKPKDVDEAFVLVENSGVKVLWDICNPNNIELSKQYFEMYKPIVFIYKKNKLVGAAHGKFGNPEVIGLDDVPETKKYSKSELTEIDLAIRQIEIF
jgi:hypothetical protein